MGTREDEYDYLFKGKYTHPNQLINKQYTSLDICLVTFVHSIIYLVFIPHRRRVLFFSHNFLFFSMFIHSISNAKNIPVLLTTNHH